MMTFHGYYALSLKSHDESSWLAKKSFINSNNACSQFFFYKFCDFFRRFQFTYKNATLFHYYSLSLVMLGNGSFLCFQMFPCVYQILVYCIIQVIFFTLSFFLNLLCHSNIIWQWKLFALSDVSLGFLNFDMLHLLNYIFHIKFLLNMLHHLNCIIHIVMHHLKFVLLVQFL